MTRRSSSREEGKVGHPLALLQRGAPVRKRATGYDLVQMGSNKVLDGGEQTRLQHVLVSDEPEKVWGFPQHRHQGQCDK